MQESKERKLGIFTWFGYRLPIMERIQLIRETGFETVLHWWDDSFAEADGATKETQVELIRNAGLFIENAHLQFSRANDLWRDTLDGAALFSRYLSDIDGLSEHGIPVAVLHPTSGATHPTTSPIGMKRVHMLVERAEKLGVRLAMENVRDTHALIEILGSIASPMLGLCYDSGHDLIWGHTPPYEILEKYKDRLFAVHFHDNMGQNDDHIAPGEGVLDWKKIKSAVDASVYQGSYTLEGDSAVIPPKRTPQEHLQMQFCGARKMLFPRGR